MQGPAGGDGPRAAPAPRRGPAAALRRRASARGGAAGGRDAEAAVSDIIGSILLVGMTVLMAAGLGVLLLAFDGPPDTRHANLSATLDPGPDGQWNTGNEEVRLAHLGGEPLPSEGTTIRFRVGTTSTALSASALGSAFGDGTLAIGERWSRTLTLARGDAVQVQVVSDGGAGSRLLGNASVVAGGSASGSVCLGDGQAPTAAFSQAPGDVTSATSGAVAVQATLSDDCSGIAAGVPPRLWYCIGANCPAATVAGTGYTAVTMTQPDPSGQPNVWRADIPGPAPSGAWSAHVGKTLKYYVYPLTDTAAPAANTGFSATASDPITVFTQHKYAEGATATVGSVANPHLLAADDGAEATFTEGAVTGSAGTLTLAATAVTSSAAWNDAGLAVGLDGDYAWTQANNPAGLQIGLADPPSQPGTITQVVVRATVNVNGANNDGWQLQACLSSTSCNAASPTFAGTQADSTISYDVTAARPGGGAWSWGDVGNLQVRVLAVKAGARDGTWQVDHAIADVTYAATNGLAAQLAFGAVHGGSAHTLQLEYRIQPGGNPYAVEVATGCSPTCAWTSRGTLSSASVAAFTHTFTAAEVAAGYQVRIVTAAAQQDTTPSQLFLDYARVATT